MKESDKIELYSNDVQEILTRAPHKLIRYGISIICGVTLIIFIGCFFFRYPDIITGDIILTTENPPAWIVAKTSGRIQELYCHDKQEITSSTLLAVLENTANTKDVQSLDTLLHNVIISDSIVFIPVLLYSKSFELGNIQSAFSAFIKASVNFENFLSINLTTQEKLAIEKQIAGKKKYSRNLQDQIKLKEKELELAQTTYERENKLFQRGIISSSDLETAKQIYINSQQAFKQLQISIINEDIESTQMSESLKKLSLQYLQDRNQYYSDLKSLYRELLDAVETWKQTYQLIPPMEGIVTFNNYWQKDQVVEVGEKVFAIISRDPGSVIGKISVPSLGIGKIKVGQIVNIKLSGYPYMEYGILKSRIRSVSLVPNQDNYSIEVELLNNMITTTGENIHFRGELSGQAEIITDNKSLGQRLISPLKYLWEDKIK